MRIDPLDPRPQPPQLPPQPGPVMATVAPGTPKVVPQVWFFYTAYCAAMALLYAGCVIAGVLIAGSAQRIAAADRDAQAAEVLLTGGALAGLGLPLMLFFAIAPFLPKTRVSWIVGIITIGIGLTSGCCLPASVPLIIFWLNQETREFFGVS